MADLRFVEIRSGTKLLLIGTGEQCKRWAARGANVCPAHGASASQVQAAAKRSTFLGGAADVLVQRLRVAPDVKAPVAVALQAIRECCIVFQRDGSLLGLIGAHFGANAYPPHGQTVRR